MDFPVLLARASEAQAIASHDLAAGVLLKLRLGGQANRCFNQRHSSPAGLHLQAQSHGTIYKPSRLRRYVGPGINVELPSGLVQ